MTTYEQNKEKLRVALIALHELPEDPSKIRDLILASFFSMRQGSGLGWQTIDDLILEVYGEAPNPPTIKDEDDT